MIFDKPIYLKNDSLILEEMNEEHKADLQQLANDNRIWKHNPGMNNPDDFSEKWFKKTLKQREERTRLPLVIVLDGKVIGSTSFYEINEDHKRLAIGYTWFHPDYWGTGINKKCKELMLAYVFETLKFNRVSFNIDTLNLRSCKAVEKLGAIKEGVLRHHMIRHDGTLRDTVVYSIIRRNC